MNHMIYIVDIDGTLADLSHRLHFIEQKPPDWDAFYAASPQDSPIESVIETVKLLKRAGATIILVTGRDEICRHATIVWLLHHGVTFDDVYMRQNGDHRQDSIIKGEILDRLTKSWNEHKIIGVFEDRKQVVDMYRKRGLKVFQVADGDF
jgi:ABC-type sugar transport system ATPase subunit